MMSVKNQGGMVGCWRRGSWTLLAGMVVLLGAGCAAGQRSAGTTPTSPSTTTARDPGDTSGPATTGPQRIIFVVEENHSFEQIIGSPQAPFLNRLATARMPT
jgi:hypothetical protein